MLIWKNIWNKHRIITFRSINATIITNVSFEDENHTYDAHSINLENVFEKKQYIYIDFFEFTPSELCVTIFKQNIF